MALRKPHSEWRLSLVNPLDIRAVGLDQVVTQLWLRVFHGNRPLVRRANAARFVQELANEIEGRGSRNFRGFAAAPGAAETWLRADLVNTLKRSPDEYTVARPLHALATRLRSLRKSDDSLASVAVYAWLKSVDPSLIDELREFVDVDVEEEEPDLATLALALLGSQHEPDQVKRDEADPVPRPICLGQARTYAEDLRALLTYRDVTPRSALVEHIKRLTGLHLGLYLLRVFRIVVEIEQSGGRSRSCQQCARGEVPSGPCPYRLEFLVDCGEDARSPIARLAESAWSKQEGRLANYVRSHLALKKLHEYATDRQRHGAGEVPDTVEELAGVEERAQPEHLKIYFDTRIDDVAEQMGDAAERVRELETANRRLNLSSFRTYVEILAHYSERRWVNYHRYLLDSLLLKNSSEGIIRQPLGGARRRRGALGASLLETLTLIAVVHEEDGRRVTRPLRVDQLLDRLAERYDILVDRPPAALSGDLAVAALLAENVTKFRARLRETGLFTDLSDAFLAQLVRPRHHLDVVAA